MSKSKSSIEDRYNAVVQYKQGVPLLQLQKRYSIGRQTILNLASRYDKDGIAGLADKRTSYHPESTKLAAIADYEANHLSLQEILQKYCIHHNTFHRWLELYEEYKKGDKFALNGNGAIHSCDMPNVIQTTCKQQRTTLKTHTMPESKEKQERRKALSKLSKKELQELLLDREAELDVLKNLEALDRERENTRRKILRELSRD